MTKKVTDVLDENGIHYDIYSDIKPNPTIENVTHGVEAFKASGADVIVAVGGGSSMDTAKAIGIIATNPEFSDVRSLEGVAPTKHKSAPIIAVPTTAGTAAEVTINYVITDVEKKRKFVCVDTNDIPIVAIVDSEMMSTMPPSLTAATGMDALTHAIEGYITKGAWELSDMFHIKAIEIISRSLRSILLPAVMDYNKDYVGEKYRDIAIAMGVKGVEKMTKEEYGKAAVEAVRQLSRDVGIPTSLAGIVKEEDIPELARSAYEDACRPGNPREVTVEDIENIYKSLL